MSMMVSFVLSFFPRDVLDEILNLIESVSEDFPSYSYILNVHLYIFYIKQTKTRKEAKRTTGEPDEKMISRDYHVCVFWYEV